MRLLRLDLYLAACSNRKLVDKMRLRLPMGLPDGAISGLTTYIEAGEAMAQLSDDCFAFGGPMQSVHETAALIASRLGAVEERETIPLAIAVGRTLAGDMVAPLPLPPFTNSAVDGYALRGADLPQTAEKAFPVVGRIQAGVMPDRLVVPGQTVRIFTGAPMPEGADTVYMQEDVRADDAGRVILPPGLKRGANVRPAGEDIAAGKVVLQAGQRRVGGQRCRGLSVPAARSRRSPASGANGTRCATGGGSFRRSDASRDRALEGRRAG